MNYVYEISDEFFPQLLLVVSDELKVPVDVFSTDLEQSTVLEYDNALGESISECMNKISSNTYTRLDTMLLNRLLENRKKLRNLYREIFS
jgi:Fe-S cluster biosynthesis and repair protein YggX